MEILLFIDCSKMARIRINTRNHTKEKPYLKKFVFFSKFFKNTCMYVSKICAEEVFVTFPGN